MCIFFSCFFAPSEPLFHYVILILLFAKCSVCNETVYTFIEVNNGLLQLKEKKKYDKHKRIVWFERRKKNELKEMWNGWRFGRPSRFYIVLCMMKRWSLFQDGIALVIFRHIVKHLYIYTHRENNFTIESRGWKNIP